MAFVLDPADPSQFRSVLEAFEASEPFALPTETVYGLAAPLYDLKALARVFELKARPTLDPLIAHVLSADDAQELLAQAWNRTEKKLIEAYWPGPLTLVCQKSGVVPDLATASTPFVALRSPQHPVFRRVLEAWGGPLAAPSANRFGRISPTTSRDVCEELGPYGLRGVLEGGACQLGLESTVVKVQGPDQVEVVRLGAISVESLRAVLGGRAQLILRSSGSGMQDAPGQLKSHYAPKKKLKFLEYGEPWPDLGQHHACLVFSFAEVPVNAQGPVFVLSSKGNLVEAAQNLFSTLRRADASLAAEILARGLSADSENLALAINDRLRRAAGL